MNDTIYTYTQLQQTKLCKKWKKPNYPLTNSQLRLII